jgi:hypothetical protein
MYYPYVARIQQPDGTYRLCHHTRNVPAAMEEGWQIIPQDRIDGWYYTRKGAQHTNFHRVCEGNTDVCIQIAKGCGHWWDVSVYDAATLDVYDNTMLTEPDANTYYQDFMEWQRNHPKEG